MAFLLVILGYLVGAIPCGYLIGRNAKNIDLRKHGSGNIGSTNAFRILGPQLGSIVFCCDFLKGFLPVLLALWLTDGNLIPILVGIATICGHNWPIFLGFRGGRGVATAGGVILALAPLAVLVLVIIWLLVLALTRYVSVASMLTAICAPFVLGGIGRSWGLFIFGLFAAAFVLYKHLPNIERLKRGIEPRLGGNRGWF